MESRSGASVPGIAAFSGGGEMGALMRSHDWASTPLGMPQGWPSLLKTTIRLLLTSNHPMFIMWGPELIQFYNDAYRRTMGPERHPQALGQRAKECWREAWHIVGPEIEFVMTGKGATWHEDALVPVTRHGRRENVWWTYGYSPIEDESGVHGVLVICNDVTEGHNYRESLQELNRELGEEVELRKDAQTALVCERDRIDAALERTQGDLELQVQDWQRLHAMSSALLQSRTLPEQFAAVLHAITDLHFSDFGVISLYDGKEGGLVTQASRGLTDAGLARLGCVPVGAGACGAAFRDARRVIVEDTETDPGYEPYREFSRQQGIRSLYCTPYFSVAGQPLGVLTVYFTVPRRPDERELRLADICAGQVALLVERWQTEKRLHQEQERSHRIFETIKDGLVLMDADFRVLQVNAAALKTGGRAASDLLGRTYWELWPDDADAPIGLALRQVMTQRRPVSLTHRRRRAGQPIWLDVSAYPHDDGIAVLYRDITEQKQAEEALAKVMDESERHRRLYETFLSTTPDLAYVFDLNHRFTYANEVLLKMWGKTWDEAIGKNCLELGYEPWHAEMHDREIELVKATKKPIRGDVPFDGTFGRRIYDYIFVPIIGPDGEVEAIAGTTRDVTERTQAEEALREANRRKDEFLAMLAHELRNPLAPISAAAEMLETTRFDTESVRRASAIIGRQVRHLTNLVDDLLDVSRVTRGLTTIRKTPQDFKSIVACAVEQVRPLIESKSHRLTLDLPIGPAQVLGDENRLVQIVANLLSNAAKYTADGGKIQLQMDVVGAQLRLSVQDDGIGIEPDMQSRVFDLFAQAERTADRTQGGLSIGLALVKSLVELHGGMVECRSAGLGKGSSFSLSLPALVAASHSPSEPAHPGSDRTPAGKQRILLVDDNVDAAHILAMYLEELGHEVFVEHEAGGALNRAIDRPDVCMLDIGLPGTDGHALARALRARRETANSLLIAVTGYGHEQDRKRSLEAGFDHHLVKPVDMEKLVALLNSMQRS